jgi:hypothetical protein
VEFPVDVALAELVPGPRRGPEVKMDGDRTVLGRLADTQATVSATSENA